MAAGKVYLIPTVIADDTQHEVIPQQVKDVIASLDYFLVENLRTARRYVSSLKLGLHIESLQFELLDKKTPATQLQQLMRPVQKGRSVGILSESGCPGIADPGAQAVEYAHQQQIEVVPLVGPSSILMALMASGFNGQSFVFHGYIPIDKNQKVKKIKAMEADAVKLSQTQIFMDTPYRNQALLQDLIANCQPTTRLSIARGITGKHELVQTKSIKEWKNGPLPDLRKIPTIFSLY